MSSPAADRQPDEITSGETSSGPGVAHGSSRPGTVLVVEDEPALRELVTRTLGFAGFETASAPDAATAQLVAAGAGRVGVAVLDVMLPDGSGFNLAQTLRAAHPGIGVLFLTARDSLEDRLTGFAFGADDYLNKPFSVAELVARVSALRRRVRASGPDPDTSERTERPGGLVLAVGDVTLDDGAHVVTRDGVDLDLSPTEFKLLRYLMQNADLVVSKEQIIGQVWHYDYVGDVGVVEKFVSQLRRKLDTSDTSYIHTVRGFGYMVRSGCGHG